MQITSFAKHVRFGLRGLLRSAELGMRHGPRLGAGVGAAAGTIFPVVGTIFGALVGLVVGGPLGLLMGLIGGAINRRWGWALAGALPGGLLILYIDTWDKWLLPSAYIACVFGAIAGFRLGKAVEVSAEDHFERFQESAKAFLAPTPLCIRLGLCAVLLWTLTDLGYTVINWLSNLG